MGTQRSWIAAAVLVLASGATALAQAVPAQPSPSWVWIEAESASKTNFPAQGAFSPANEKEAAVLSGGKWLSADNADFHGQKLFAEWQVQVPEAGTWRLYARKFWKHGPFTWSMGESSGAMTREVALLDDAYMRKFVGANWVYVGDVKVNAAGVTTLRIESTETTGAIAFDCFALTKTPFEPRGKLKPGDKYDHAPDGWFPFEPDPDTFADSPISMRRLNETQAGDGGWIEARGKDFVHEKTGEKVRFWAVNTGTDSIRKDDAAIAQQARFWAKRGVNLVRVHGGIWKQDDWTQADPALIERLQAYVAAMKKEGIYVYFSSYFPLWLDFDEKTTQFPGYKGGKHPFSIQFIDPKFQEIQRGWFKAALTSPNPHGGVPLGQDPALAMVEMVNEDSFFFWTFTPYENIPAEEMAILEKAFGEWITTKHGSIAKAFSDWGGGPVRGDEATAGRVGFMSLAEVFNSKTPRAQETAEFLARHQRAWFESLRTYLKKDLGYQGLVSASNWITADARTLYPLERWSNAPGDFLDRHGYWSGPHDGPTSGYSISPGDSYDDKSCLVGPVNTPLYEVNYLDKPTTLTEINWTPPNRFRAEFPVLSAVYGALQGNDAWFFFATGSSGWDQDIGKFSLHTPAVAGQWPATSLIYRRNLVKEAPAALQMNLKLADLFALKGAPVATQVNMDQLRFGSSSEQAKTAEGGINPLYFLVGRVDTEITQNGGPTQSVDLSKYVDAEKKTVRSLTGETAWDFGKGVVTIDAPQANGAVGFLSRAGDIQLGTLHIKTPLEYGSVLLVALDDKPLTDSSKMLLQVMTEDAMDGFSAPGTGKRKIESLGHAPLVVKDIAGDVSFKGAGLKITRLDFNGYPVGASTPLTGPMKLDSRTLYYLIEK